MLALISISLLASVADLPSVASEADASAPRERKFCTRVETRSGSRMGYRRLCLTAAEWRERYGPDWRQSLTGRQPDEDFDTVDTRSRVHSTLPTSGMGSGGTNGGTAGPR